MTLILSKVHSWTSQPRMWSSLPKWPKYPQMRTICTQQPQIMSYSIQMTLIPSNTNNNTSQPQIKSSPTQGTLILSNMHNCTLQPLSLQAPIDAQIYTNAPPTLSTPKALPSTKTSQHPLLNQATIKSLNLELALAAP